MSPIRTPTGSDESLTIRALTAYYRTPGAHLDAVSRTTSGLVFHNERAYVVLRNHRGGVVAVYRARWQQLRRLWRWPAAIENNQPTGKR